MRGFVLGLSLSVAFIAGSLFGSLGESTADAQSGRQRWEYKCESMESSLWGRRAEGGEGRARLSELGRQGWVFAFNRNGSTLDLCFKRPL